MNIAARRIIQKTSNPLPLLFLVWEKQTLCWDSKPEPNSNRVGHLILRALAIWASNPQNALARISFHSPKSLPPPPRPGHSNHFSHLLF